MPVSLTQYRGPVGILSNRLFVRALNYNSFSLISHSEDHFFLYCDFHHNNIRFTFFLIFLMLLTLKRKTFKSAIHFSVLSFLTVAVNYISLSADVQLNPGPKNKSDVNFSICHWNLNSIAAHNYTKVFLLKAYIAVYKLDIICIFFFFFFFFFFFCISKTYLDTSIKSHNGNLEILGYNLIRSDHPSRG